MNDLYCPYCDENLGNHVDDCYEPNIEYEHECPRCSKIFIFEIEYYPSFTSRKADCLNGKKHKYEKILGYPKEFFKNKRRCSMCGKEIIINDAKGKKEEKVDGNEHGK